MELAASHLHVVALISRIATVDPEARFLRSVKPQQQRCSISVERGLAHPSSNQHKQLLAILCGCHDPSLPTRVKAHLDINRDKERPIKGH